MHCTGERELMRTLTAATNVTCVHEEWVKCNNKTIFFLFLLSNSHLRYSREEEPTRNQQKCQNNHPKSASQPPKNTFIDLTTHVLKGREASELYTFREISARRKIYRDCCALALWIETKWNFSTMFQLSLRRLHQRCYCCCCFHFSFYTFEYKITAKGKGNYYSNLFLVFVFTNFINPMKYFIKLLSH